MAGKIRQKKKTKRSEVTDCGGIEPGKLFEEIMRFAMEPRKKGTVTNPKDVKIKNKINKPENL